nr:extensin-like [Vicugna pacos]
MRGTWEERSAPGAGAGAAGARRPFGDAGNNHAPSLPGAAGRCQLDPAGGGSARRSACPGDLSRPGRSAPAAQPLPEGTKRHHARGRRPRAESQAGRRGCMVPVVAPTARHRIPRQTAAQSPEPAQEPPTRPKIRPRRPQPTTCQCTPYPGIASGRTPPPQPDSSALSSWYPPFQFPLNPQLSSADRPSPKRPANPWPDPRRLGQPPRRDPYPYSVKPQSAGRQAAPPGNSPALPSPAPGGSRPWLRLSVPEPQLPVRRQKPALLRREPPHRPSAPPPRRGLSSREGGAHARLDLASD